MWKAAASSCASRRSSRWTRTPARCCRSARQIVDEVLEVLEHSSPELVADIAQNGIVLTGGGSLLYGFDKLISERTEIACSIADDADSCVANGCGRSLQWISSMQEGTINLARRKLMKEQ